MTNISNREELRRLIARYVRGKASKEEEAFLKKYYDHFDDQYNGLDGLTDNQQTKLKSQIFYEVKNKFNPDLQHRNYIVQISRIAAAVLVLIAAAVGFWYISHNGKVLNEMVVQNQQNLLVVDSAITNQKHIYLPDGSYVVLEPGSRLEYSKEFMESERRIELDGEAFFDVQHDSLRPFVVLANGVTTRVLGTAFSISSSEKNNEFSISVTRGKVEVSDEAHSIGILEKDDQLILDRANRRITKNKLNKEETAVIEPSEFMMDNMTVAEAIGIVSKRWDCQFEVKDPDLLNCRFTTSFVPTDDLEEVVAVIATVIGAENSIKNKVVSLSGEGCHH